MFHDNDWAPSDWDMRVALKVLPSDVALWTAGMTPGGIASDFAWHQRALAGDAAWSVSSTAAYYEREGCTLEVHAAEGVLFKACSTLGPP